MTNTEVRLKYVATLNNDVLGEDTDPDYELQYLDIGNVDSSGQVQDFTSIRFADAPSRARRRVRHGDVIVSCVRTYLQAIASIEHPPDNLIVSTGFAVVRPIEGKLRTGFCKFALRDPRFLAEVERRSVGVSYPAINSADLATISIQAPPDEMQQRVENFLNRETARLDALLAAKQRLLNFLGSKRTATIARAVAQGLDTKVRVRDSGVPSLGDIPEHWSLVPLRHLLSFGPKNGISPPQTGPDGVLSFSISAVRDGQVTIDGNEKLVAMERKTAQDYFVKEGDILLVRGNGNLSLVGTCGLIETAPNECTYPDILMLMRANSRITADFLVAALNSSYVRGQIESLVQTTNGTFKLSGEDVRALRIAVPPIDEQRATVEHIARETTRLDAVRAATERTISLLKERRAALIAAAVTGRLDVRSEA